MDYVGILKFAFFTAFSHHRLPKGYQAKTVTGRIPKRGAGSGGRGVQTVGGSDLDSRSYYNRLSTTRAYAGWRTPPTGWSSYYQCTAFRSGVHLTTLPLSCKIRCLDTQVWIPMNRLRRTLVYFVTPFPRGRGGY